MNFIRAMLLLSLCCFLLSEIGPSAARAAEPETSAPTAESNWVITTIDDNVSTMGLRPAIAINPTTNMPWVTHFDQTQSRLGLVQRAPDGIGNCGPGNAWICSIVESNGAGHQSSIDFNPNGDYAIAYSFANSALLKLRKRIGATTATDTVATGNVAGELIDNPGVKFAQDGQPRVINRDHFKNNTKSLQVLRYNYPSNTAGLWSQQPVTSNEGSTTSDTSFGAFASFDISLANQPAVAYRQQSEQGASSSLSYAEYQGSGGNCSNLATWHCYSVDPSNGSGNNIALHLAQCANCGDGTRIAYYNSVAGELRLARYTANVHQCGAGGHDHWYCAKIDSVGGGEAMGVGMSHFNGTPVIAYYDNNDAGFTHGILKLATYVGSDGNCGFGTELNKWQCEVVDDGGVAKDKVGQYATVAHDSNGNIYIAYHNATTGSLRIAMRRRSAPYFSKTYTPATLQAGAALTVKYTIDNSSSTHLTGLNVIDSLSGGTTLATPLAITNTCGGSVTASSDNRALVLSGGILGKTSQCTITAKLIAGPQPGAYTDETGVLGSNEAFGSTASANLTIVAAPGAAHTIYLPSIIR